MTPHGGRARLLAAHPGAELYGSDRMFLESVRGFTAAGHEVCVVVPHDGPLLPGLQEAGATVEFLETPVLRRSALSVRGMSRLLGDAWGSVPSARRLISRYRPDVVYVSTLTQPTWLALGQVARARVVCHVHEAEEHLARTVRAGMALPLACADVVLANSHFTASVLRASLPGLARRTAVVPNGVVGPPGGPTPPRADLRGAPALVYAGRLSPRKGPDVAVAAVRLLRAAGHHVSLDVIGSVFPGYEWFAEQLRREAEDLIADQSVRLHGFADSPWQALARADIALVPSVLPESFGNAAAEAILAQRPLVVSRTGGLPEAVAGAQSAALAAPGDPASLADAVRRLLDRWDDMGALTAQALEAARVRFSPETYRGRVCELTVSGGWPSSGAASTRRGAQ